MELFEGKKARVVGYEMYGIHDFNIGDIVEFVSLKKDMSDKKYDEYNFINEDGHTQHLIESEFEWV